MSEKSTPFEVQSGAYGEALNYLYDSDAEAQVVFGEWAKGHTTSAIEILDYNLEKYPYQRLDVLRVEATPSLELAGLIGRETEEKIGINSHSRLVEALSTNGIVSNIEDNAQNGIKSLFVTAHLEDVQDTGMAHNALFVASGDENFAYRNVLVINPMMKRLGFKTGKDPIPLVNVLSHSGPVIFAMPPAALKRGISNELFSQYTRAYSKVFSSTVEDASVIHWALTGTRALKLGDSRFMPFVDDAVAKTAKRRAPNAMGAAINLHQGGEPCELILPRYLESPADVHDLMQELADASSRISGKKIIYGLPG